MLAQYAGNCRGCGNRHAVGEDIYWTRETGAYCWDCIDNPKPTAAQFAIAEDCGFVPVADAGARGWAERRFVTDRNDKPSAWLRALRERDGLGAFLKEKGLLAL